MRQLQGGARRTAVLGLSLFSLGLASAWGQPSSISAGNVGAGWISCPQLRSDLDTLFRWIEETHPQPYAHVTRDEVLQMKAQVSQAWNGDSVPALAGAQGLARFCRTFQDSHTGLRTMEWLDQVAPVRGILPLEVHTVAGQTLIQSNVSGQLPPGAVLRSINDRGASVAWQWALSLVAVEGEGPAASEVASVRADRAWPAFAGWAYGLEPGTKAQVVAEWQGNRIEAALPVAPSPARRTPAHARKSLRNAGSWDWGVDGSPTYLKIARFPYRSRAFDRDLRRFFRGCERRKVQGIVLDLRDNPGGSVRTMQQVRSWWGGDERVWPEQMQFRSTPESWASNAWVRRPRTSRRLERSAPSDAWSAFTLGCGSTPVNKVFQMEFSGPFMSASRPYTGALAVLMDGTTASAATTLAAWLAHSRGALLVGGPALGSGASTSGQPVFRNLPSTGWPVMISSAVFSNPGGQHSLFPLRPHLPVAPDVANLNAGGDAVRAAAEAALLAAPSSAPAP